MRSIKRLVYGWRDSDAATYRQCYEQYGGSINMHPDVLDFVTEKTGQRIRYFQRQEQGEIVGGYAVLDDKHVGARVWKKYPISYDDVMLPLAEKCRAMFPERCNRISPALRNNLININYRVARKGTVCIVKDDFSAKTEKNRRNEFRKFVAAGGSCVDQIQFSAAELAEIYMHLFNARFAGEVRCHDKADLTAIIEELRHLVFGNILLINEKPCAMDLVFYAESANMVYFDVPNGGVDPAWSHLSPGSLLMWKNIQSAREYCARKQKKMIFSIGALEKKWAYKLRWANVHKTGKPLF
mgnify:FL=1